jgi:hypothetical protein
MSTIEGALVVYGKPVYGVIITKEAAINLVQEAMMQGLIVSYRIEEETEAVGKLIGSMEMNGSLDQVLKASRGFNEGMQAAQNMHYSDGSVSLQQAKGALLRMGEEQTGKW